MPSSSKRSNAPRRAPQPPPPQSAQPELVDPAFILKGLGGAFLVAILLAYVAVCIVYVRGQWQLALAPSHTLTTTPAAEGLAFTEVHFGIDSSSKPQLDGWWIPATDPAEPTALILHDGKGTMSDALPAALALHNTRFNVLLFDYRGFGRSAGDHPTQQRMQQDADAALSYINSAHSSDHGGLVVYGIGLGSSTAVALAQAHLGISAIILQDPDGDLRSRAEADQRSHLVPASLLFHQDFPLAAPLQTLTTPKLLIAHTGGNTPPLFQQAAAPKLTIELPNASPADLEQAITRFRTSYLH